MGTVSQRGVGRCGEGWVGDGSRMGSAKMVDMVGDMRET